MVGAVRAGRRAEGTALQVPPSPGNFYHADARLYPANEIRLSEGRTERPVVSEALPVTLFPAVWGRGSVGGGTPHYPLANLPNVSTVAV